MRRSNRHGAVLLEAMVALSVLAIAGVGFVQLMRSAARALELAHSRDRMVANASAFMDVVALWPASDLDRRLGARQQGPWLLHVERTRLTYHVVLIDSTSGRPVLETELYRPLSRTPQ